MTNIRLSYVSNIDDALAAELWKHTNDGSSGFRWWLSYYRNTTVAMVVYVEDKVIGWAACRVGDENSEIGVFIDKEYRRQGIGTLTFDSLLLRLKQENKGLNKPMDFDRRTCMTKLMTDHLEVFGFMFDRDMAA